MRHVKAEHVQHDKDLDDEDDLDLEDDARRSEHPFHHAMHHHHHQGYGSEEHLKEEAMKNDCTAGGVPIPATKPKIWSLADTAACKTPPPPSHPHHQQYQLHHQQQQQQQHYIQHQHHSASQPHHHSQQPWLSSGGAVSGVTGSGGSLSSFALPSSASMSPSSAATAPYSSASARYGGFLSSSSGGQLHYNPNSSSGSTSSASSSAATGFPEVGTDTPPQTPPNMKVATPNGVIQGPPAGYCPGGNVTNTNGSTNNANHYSSGYLSTSSGSASSASSFNSRLQNSPHKDFSPVSQNSILHPHQTTASLPPSEATTAFKPFYKGYGSFALINELDIWISMKIQCLMKVCRSFTGPRAWAAVLSHPSESWRVASTHDCGDCLVSWIKYSNHDELIEINRFVSSEQRNISHVQTKKLPQR